MQVHRLVIVMRGGDKWSSEVGHNGSRSSHTNKLNSGSSDSSRCSSTIGTSCYIAVVWPVTTQHTPRTSWNVLLLVLVLLPSTTRITSTIATSMVIRFVLLLPSMHKNG